MPEPIMLPATSAVLAPSPNFPISQVTKDLDHKEVNVCACGVEVEKVQSWGLSTFGFSSRSTSSPDIKST